MNSTNCDNIHEKHTELKSTLSLSTIFGLRMLAIFMYIPIFTAYTQNLKGSTPLLMGIALGVYGLTQAIFQIPFGAWSDRVGRKPMIFFGLFIFFIGSLIGIFAENIIWLILARALQGVGAVGSSLMALLADLTSQKNRTKAMAAIGVSMGIFSTLALISGPAIALHFGFSSVFLASALLTLISISILYGITPDPKPTVSMRRIFSLSVLFQSVLKNPYILSLNVGIFLLHAIFTALFYACSLLLKPLVHNASFFYLPVLMISFLFLFPCIYIAEKKKKTFLAFVSSIFILLLAQIILIYFPSNILFIGTALSFFFIGFNFLEASLPSMISKAATPESQGTAMGIYSSAQFFGIFVGGTSAGAIDSLGNTTTVLIFTACLSLIWLGVALAFPPK
jgi:MFS family permease